MKVSDIMTTAVEFIGGNAPVKDAAELMGELDVGGLPVGTPGALEGILTDRDLLFRIVAAGLDPKTVLVRDVASRPVITCRESDTIHTVMDLMAANHIRRMPVQNDAGTVTGWVTLADMSRKLLVESHSLQEALSLMTEGSREAA